MKKKDKQHPKSASTGNTNYQQLSECPTAVPKDELSNDSLKVLAEDYLAILENSLNGTVVVEASTGEVLFANRTALKIFGYNSMEELGEANLMDFAHPDDRERAFVAIIKDFFSSVSHDRYEFRAVTRHGEERRVLTLSMPIKYQNKLAGLISLVDITESKKTEDELAQSEALLRSFFNSPGLLCGVVEIEGEDLRYITVNAAMAAMYGLTPEAVVCKLASEIGTDREIVKLFIGNYRKSQENNVPSYFEYRRQVGSEMRWFYVTVTFLGLEPNSGHPRYAFVTSDITERRRAEEALRYSEEKLRAMFESMAEAATITDLKGRIVDANPAAVKLHRYDDKQEIIGINASDLVAERDRQRAIKDSINTLKTGKSKLTEYKLTTKGGALIDGEFGTAVIRDHSGNPTGFIGISRDISDRKRIEEKLRESERKLQTVFGSIMDGLVVTDMMGMVIDANEAAVSIGKYKNVEDIIGRNGIDFITEGDRKRVAKVLSVTIADPKRMHSEVIEYIAQDKDGNPFYGESSAAVIRDSSGQPTGMIFVTRDITERKRMQDKIREDQEKLRTVFESISDGISVTDALGTVTEINDAWVKIGGYNSKDELIGKNSSTFIAPQERDIMIQRMMKRFEAGYGSEKAIYKFLKKDGQEYDVDLTVGMLHDKDGKVTGLVTIGRDITQQKRSLEQLQASEERYRLLAENISDVIWIMDMNLRFTYISPSIFQLRGYTAEESMAQPLEDNVTPGSLETISKIFIEELLSENAKNRDPRRTRTFLAELKRKDGSTVWTEQKVSFLYDQNNNATGILGITRDISERKKAEEAVLARDRYFRAIMDLSSEAILVLGTDGNITDTTGGLERISGYTRDRTIGASAMEFIHPDDAPQLVILLTELMQNPGKTKSVEARLKNAQGAWQWTECMITNLLDHPDVRGIVTHLLDISERKHAEEAMRLQEMFYRRLIEKAPDSIITIDAQGSIAYGSPSMPRLLGYSETEGVGDSVFSFVNPDDVGKVMELFTTIAKMPGASEQVEARVQHKDGSWRWVEAIGTNHFDDPAVRGIVVNIRDITERKKAEELLRASEERYRLLADNISDVIWILSLDFKYSYLSPSVYQLRGYTVEEATRTPIDKTVTPSSLEYVVKALNEEVALLKAGNRDPHESRTLEVELYRKDGSTVWTEMKVSGLYDKDNNLTALIGSTRDITKRKRMEEAVRASGELLSAVFESMKEGIAVVDKDIKFIRWNKALLDIAGLKAEEMMGKSGLDFLLEEDRQKAADDLVKQLMGVPLGTPVYRVRLPSGVIKHVEMSISNLKDYAGNITEFVTSIRDITERIRIERDLRKALDDLQRSNKDLEQFVYVASHDMQEPLRMIASYTQLLGKRYKGKLDSDADEFIGFAVDGASRMQKMINDLLIFSRVTTRGKEFEPVDLEKVFSDAVDNLKIAIEENKATITHDQFPKVMADEPQMVRLLQNLIGNAIKFHGQEPPIIHVGAKEGTEEWAISVKDNGIGIDKKFFDRLFIVFQRLHTRDQYPGTGIGLAVCKKTVERHGGRIWVESEGEGKGSVFTFTLPKRALTKKVEPEKSLQVNDSENNNEKKEERK